MTSDSSGAAISAKNCGRKINKKTNKNKKKIITRRRIIKTCKYCYFHKLKCDQKQPCAKCVAMDIVDQCEYGFANTMQKDGRPVDTGDTTTNSNNNSNNPLLNTGLSTLSSGSHPGKQELGNVLNVTHESAVYKSKYFYPFFTSSINDKILSTETYGQVHLSDSNFNPNEITKFNRSIRLTSVSFNEIFDLLPTSYGLAKTQIELYFEWVHPIIPVLEKQQILQKLYTIYDHINSNVRVNALDLLLIISILFCTAYLTVASGIIPDLLMCNKYYVAYKYLLEITEFTFRPQLESLQSFLVVNFVIDPNMVDSISYSPMLVRIGQQLGLHRTTLLATKGKDKESKCYLILLWNFLLYLEGSASVVSGFPFSTNSYLLEILPIEAIGTTKTDDDDNNFPNYSFKDPKFPIEYTVGRCKINMVFREIMELTLKNEISADEKNKILNHIKILYDDIIQLCRETTENDYPNAQYYNSTLHVFIYRLHLRYCALDTLQSERSSKMLSRTNNELEPVKQRDITWILETSQNVKDEVLPLSLLLLLSTLKRLVQKNVNNFAWYTRGSTVMQYLFVVLRDLYQNPRREYPMQDFSGPFHDTIDEDIRDIISVSPLYFKFMLIDELLILLEWKLAPLWNQNDLYKFILVKTVKEKVWATQKSIITQYETQEKPLLKKCSIFATGYQNLENMSSINLEDCLNQWNVEAELFDPEKILIDWLSEFH